MGERAGIEAEFARRVAGPGTAGLALCAQMELELAALAEPDRQPFMEDLGLSELAAGRVIRASYQVCGLSTFFTVGDDEVRAWSVPTGTLAPQAAGLVHTDMERGFIRAEAVSFEGTGRSGRYGRGAPAGATPTGRAHLRCQRWRRAALLVQSLMPGTGVVARSSRLGTWLAASGRHRREAPS